MCLVKIQPVLLLKIQPVQTGYALRAFTRTLLHHQQRRKNHTTYPQPDSKIPAFAPGQISVGTGGQYSIGADTLLFFLLTWQFLLISILEIHGQQNY
jgi:hypothetical protein